MFNVFIFLNWFPSISNKSILYLSLSIALCIASNEALRILILSISSTDASPIAHDSAFSFIMGSKILR